MLALLAYENTISVKGEAVFPVLPPREGSGNKTLPQRFGKVVVPCEKLVCKVVDVFVRMRIMEASFRME